MQADECGRCPTEVQQRIRKQHTKNGVFLGACLYISDEDLSFVGQETEWLSVVKRTAKNSLIMEIRAVTTP